jgi:hypothetical protein
VPPHALVEHADAVARLAERFRTNAQATAGSVIDTAAVIVDWPSLDQAGQTLSVAHAAAIIGVSESCITRKLRGGILAGSRSGPRGRWLVDTASLAALEAARRTRKVE